MSSLILNPRHSLISDQACTNESIKSHVILTFKHMPKQLLSRKDVINIHELKTSSMRSFMLHPRHLLISNQVCAAETHIIKHHFILTFEEKLKQSLSRKDKISIHELKKASMSSFILHPRHSLSNDQFCADETSSIHSHSILTFKDTPK